MDIARLSGVTATVPSPNTQAQPVVAAASPSASPSGTTAAPSGSVYYSSPIISVDTTTGDVVWKYRDTSTGEILYQSPSQAALQYERSQKLTESNSPGKAQGRTGQTSTIYG